MDPWKYWEISNLIKIDFNIKFHNMLISPELKKVTLHVVPLLGSLIHFNI